MDLKPQAQGPASSLFWGEIQRKEQSAQVPHCCPQQFLHVITCWSYPPVGPLCAVAGQLGGHRRGTCRDHETMVLLICIRFMLAPTA